LRRNWKTLIQFLQILPREKRASVAWEHQNKHACHWVSSAFIIYFFSQYFRASFIAGTPSSLCSRSCVILFFRCIHGDLRGALSPRFRSEKARDPRKRERRRILCTAISNYAAKGDDHVINFIVHAAPVSDVRKETWQGKGKDSPPWSNKTTRIWHDTRGLR